MTHNAIEMRQVPLVILQTQQLETQPGRNMRGCAPLLPSSMTTMAGRPSSARATCSFRFMPPDSAAAGAGSFLASPTASAAASAAPAPAPAWPVRVFSHVNMFPDIPTGATCKYWAALVTKQSSHDANSKLWCPDDLTRRLVQLHTGASMPSALPEIAADNAS